MPALLGIPLRIAIVMACAASTATGARIECRLSAEKVPAYSRVEIRFADTFGVDNPDDPRQADVQGIFVSPSGRPWRMPGFLYQDFRRENEAVVPDGKPEWCVRFTPTEPGQWKARVEARVAGKTHTMEAGEFGSYKPLRKEFASAVKSRDGEPTIKLHRWIDPTGLHLHNGIWAAGLTGAVGALPWFTCDYIDPFDMYHVPTGFSRFVADWKIYAGPWRPVAARVVADAEGPGDTRWGPLVLPSKRVMKRLATDVYTVGRDGSLLEAKPINSYLFGRVVHKDLRRPPTFAVDYPVDGRFVVTVNYAVGKPDSKIPVLIHLDGREAARKTIAIERGHGENAISLNRWGNVRACYGVRL